MVMVMVLLKISRNESDQIRSDQKVVELMKEQKEQKVLKLRKIQKYLQKKWKRREEKKEPIGQFKARG
mgnify:CR=1 FL=1